MMAGMKLVRTDVTPDYSDNSDDVDGYMDIFRRLVGEDMVHARTPAEYWAAKDGACTCATDGHARRCTIHTQQDYDLSQAAR
jgi:hypothetical protein